MKADALLTELEGNLPFAALNEYNTLLEESSEPQGIVLGLLLTSRRCDEILDLLQAEKRSHAELAAIFTSLGHILLNIAGELSEYSHVGLYISQQLLHNYEASIYKLIGPGSTNKNSKSVLRCLTGMVMIGGEAANEVLSTIDWGKINIDFIANRQSMKDVYDVRAWCIYLILAFLNSSEEPNLTKQFLHKKDLLPAIFRGLVWDPCERVINVIKVMQESVLLNPSVTKTMKIAIFTPTTTKHLLDLYQWLGPVGKLAKGGNLETLDDELAKEILKERAQIKEALHRFLLTLCTSTTHGIVFKEKIQGGSIKSNNWYVYKILSNLKTPWDSPEESELMSALMGKCPDLLNTYFPTLKSSLQPRPTKAFVSLMDMVTHIIDNQKPWMKLETHGLEGTVGCIIPQPIYHPYIKSLLESCHGSVRLAGVRLVHSILSKTKETVEDIKSSKELSQEVKFHTQEKIMRMVLKVVKSEPIIGCWDIASGHKTTETSEQELSSVEILEQPHKITELLNIARVLTLYNELHPKEAIHEVLDPLKMLGVIHTLPGNNTDNSEQSKAQLELQVLCLELLTHSKQSLEIVIDSSGTADHYNDQIKENILYKLITTYTQSGKATITNEDEALKVLLTDKCFAILSNALAKVGLPPHYDGNVKFWLRHIPHGKEAKLASFLTRVIQKAVSSLHHYTDAIIKAASNLKEHLNEGLVSPFMNSLEATDMEDTQEVSSLSVSLPFSRLVLAAVDLLEEDLDQDHIEYFSKVISNYQYSVSDPELLAAFLLQNDRVLTPALVDYLRAWCKESIDMQQPISTLGENPNLSEILKYLFMTDDVLSVEQLLEYDKLKDIISVEDLDLVISQLLLYIHLKSDTKKNKKVQKRYVDVLKSIYLFLESNHPNDARLTLQTVLQHSRVLAAYQPLSPKSPVTELALCFIEIVLQKHPGLVSKTVPYFDTTMKALEAHLNRNESVKYWEPLSPFLTSEHTVVSYEAAEQILTLCLKTPHLTSGTVESILIGVVKLISKTTSAKRKLKEESVELLLCKFLEWGRAKEGSTSQEDLVHHLEALLIQVMSPAAIEQLTKGDLKSLLQFQPACPDLCCHLLKQHPPHGRTLVKHLKKHGTILPCQAPLLAQLLNQSDTQETATKALTKVLSEIERWVLDAEGEEDETRLLLPHVLNLGLLDERTVTDVCQKLYEEMVTNKQSPPKKLMSLLPVFRSLSKAGHTGHHGDLPGEHLSLLHICLSCVKTTYQKENQKSSLLLNVAQLISEVFTKIDEGSLKCSLTTNKLWASFVKQVLRVGITDPKLGPDMIQILDRLSSVLYKKHGYLKDEGESVLPITTLGESVLPVTTLYQMIIGHSQYLTLMFAQEEDWERLKEKMVALQQTLVDCEERVCQEGHVAILLGAYGASMSLLDQRILKLLFTYEKKGFMTSYQPVLWGKAAIVHFGVKSPNVGLFRDPMPEQVLGLLSMEKILHTCYNFDTRLPFEPTDIIKGNKEVYDVRFLLPLMLHLADEERLSEIDYAECGAVVVGLIALTSHQRPVRGAGAAVLRCMVDKMERSKHRRLSLPWVWMVGVVSCALNGKERRLPALTTHFLIQASQLLSQPEHPMYHIVLNYVFLKPDFKLYFVPELYRLYNSAHVTDSRKHRSFLLSTLSSGIRQIIDYKISQRTFTATLMMGMLQAPSADAELKVQVLEVLEAMVRIPLGAVELVRQHSLLTVLSADSHDLSSGKSSHLLLLSAVVRVLHALWKTIFASTTRKDIIASEGPEEYFPELEDGSQAKRKMSPETSNLSRKRMKVDPKSDVSSGNYDAEMDEGIESSKDEGIESSKDEGIETSKDEEIETSKDEEIETSKDEEIETSKDEGIETSKDEEIESSKDISIPVQKLLPPLFIHEYLNTLVLILPAIIASCPPATLATYLELVADVVQYVGTVTESSNKRQKIRLAALAPEIMKEQVFSRVQWHILHDHLQEYLSDDEEVKLLGDKSKDFLKTWRNEPLSLPLQKLQPDAEKSHGIMKLKEASLNLLNALGR